jgi:hypothetical protein
MSGPARDRFVVPVDATPSSGARSGIWSGVLAAVGIAAFAAYKLWQALVGDPLVWQDSLSYQASGANSLTSRALWAGYRPPVTPLLWKVTGTLTSFVVVQTGISILAWTALAVVVGRLARRGWPQLVAGGLVLGFAVTTPIVQWDRSVLSESISLSLLALLFAAAIAWARRPTWPRSAAVMAVALVFAATRDTQIWVVAMLALALGGSAAWHAWRASRPAGTRDLQPDPGVVARVAWVAAALAVVVLLTGWSSAAAHRTQQNLVNVFTVRVFPYVGRVDWFADHGMPDARALRALARAAKGIDGDAPVVGVDLAAPQFAALNRWLHDDGPSTYMEWLLTHPGYVLGEPLHRPERTFNNAEGHLAFYAAPDRTDVSLANTLLYPAWFFAVAAAVAALAGAWATGRWRLHEWQMIVLLGVLGLLHMLIAWHGDGMEVTRHAAIGNVQARLAVILALGLLLPRAEEDAAQPCSESGTAERSRPVEALSRPESR